MTLSWIRMVERTLKKLGCFDEYVINRRDYLLSHMSSGDVWMNMLSNNFLTYNTFCLSFSSFSFVWGDTPEGSSYWGDISNKLKDLIRPKLYESFMRCLLVLKRKHLYRKFITDTAYLCPIKPATEPEILSRVEHMLVAAGRDPDNLNEYMHMLCFLAARHGSEYDTTWRKLEFSKIFKS